MNQGKPLDLFLKMTENPPLGIRTAEPGPKIQKRNRILMRKKRPIRIQESGRIDAEKSGDLFEMPPGDGGTGHGGYVGRREECFAMRLHQSA